MPEEVTLAGRAVYTAFRKRMAGYPGTDWGSGTDWASLSEGFREGFTEMGIAAVEAADQYRRGNDPAGYTRVPDLPAEARALGSGILRFYNAMHVDTDDHHVMSIKFQDVSTAAEWARQAGIPAVLKYPVSVLEGPCTLLVRLV